MSQNYDQLLESFPNKDLESKCDFMRKLVNILSEKEKKILLQIISHNRKREK